MPISQTPRPEPKLMSEGIISQREKIYERAEAAKNGAPPVEPTPIPVKPDLTPATPAAPGAATPTPPVVPPAKPDAIDAKPIPAVQAVPGDEKKMVPLEALHEARKEKQTAVKERDQLKDQVQILLKDLHDLRTTPPGDLDPVLGETDYDKKLKSLESEIADLRAKDTDRDKMTEQQRISEAQTRFKADLEKTHSELQQEGFDGFKDVKSLVGDELNRIRETDGEDAAKTLDNPDGWKKIFKEVVYPRISNFGKAKVKEEKVEGKIELKKGAGLLLGGDAPPAPKDDKKEEYSYEEYITSRSARSPQPQRRTGYR